MDSRYGNATKLNPAKDCHVLQPGSIRPSASDFMRHPAQAEE